MHRAVILYNEILLWDNEEVIYKTVSNNLYGMFSTKRGEIVEPSFLHIYSFEGSQAVIVDQSEKYWLIDYNGIIDPLDDESEALYKSFIIKNSRCNCCNDVELQKRCVMCNGRGQIENQYGSRQLAKLLGQV